VPGAAGAKARRTEGARLQKLQEELKALRAQHQSLLAGAGGGHGYRRASGGSGVG